MAGGRSLIGVWVACGLLGAAASFGAVPFPGTVILGRPTDTTATVSLVADRDLEAYVEYGPGAFTTQTPIAPLPAGTPVEHALVDLPGDAGTVYRVRFRDPGVAPFAEGTDHSFRTRRARGETFAFTVQADPHLGDSNTSEELYRVGMGNVRDDAPDFHVDLGDTFMTEKYGATCADAIRDFAEHRAFFGIAGASVPLFLVNGNHEGEVGWLKDGTGGSLAVCATLQRRAYYPCPIPGGFYSGSTEPEPFVGVRDGYYAWEWGDALFVVLDPFWYTEQKPKADDEGWGWTLGKAQYDWLCGTLSGSSARFKFVFVHHLVGGNGPEARGGIEAVPYGEWGGENPDGTYGFDSRRPGWGESIHPILVANRVSAVFHGHDHVFVRQELDGVTYQECPRPDFPNTTDTSNADRYGYAHGDVMANSGHLRVTVSPTQAAVEYVRTYLPGTGTNGEVAFSYTIRGVILPGDCDGDVTVSIGEVQRAVNMFLGLETPSCGADCTADGSVSIGEVQKVINGFLGVTNVC